MKKLSAAVVLIAVISSVASAQAPNPAAKPAAPAAALQTRPELTNFNETSRYEDVVAFMRAAAKASPKIHVTTFGYTTEGRALPLAIIGAPAATAQAVRATGRLRVHIQGNIHGGEVEGKESAQILLRELAEGKHADWLQSMVFIIAPIYNADGNERFSLTNRGAQHGPIGGQGQRPNAQGLDLNRDHMKLESPEARAFARLLTEYDPHVSMDLHTTNGTRHAYHITYAPPLNPATDPAILDLLRRDWLPSVTKTVKSKYGWDYFYYGNLQGRSNTPEAADERAWRSFDHRPRFNNNYIGLRNRFAILSEAYAYSTFEERIRATSRFVNEVVSYAHAHAAEIRKITEAADARQIVGTQVPLRAEMFRAPDLIEVLLGEVTAEKHPVDGHPMEKRADVRKPERVADYSQFKATETGRVPASYYLAPTLTVALERLSAHGVKLTALTAPETLAVEEFHITGSEAANREFQGHKERTLAGAWVAAERQLPAGTLRVDMTQPLGRLAFYLLEPRSDDGLVNWNLLDDAIGTSKLFPILRSRN